MAAQQANSPAPPQAYEKTGIRLTHVCIQNFRGIEHVNVTLGHETVLIGENNTGKTSFLQALNVCLQHLRSGVIHNPVTQRFAVQHRRPRSSTEPDAGPARRPTAATAHRATRTHPNGRITQALAGSAALAQPLAAIARRAA